MSGSLQFGAPGFADPVADAQLSFRQLMGALAHPALPRDFAPPSQACGPLTAEAAAVLLTLADHGTPLWLDEPLAQCADVRNFIAFHCGSPVVGEAKTAAFAFFADARSIAPLTRFAQGEPDYPDRSTTLVVQVERFSQDGPVFAGPGVRSPRRFRFAPEPAGFVHEWERNAAVFPLGVDIFLVAPGAVAALPRSLRIGND